MGTFYLLLIFCWLVFALFFITQAYNYFCKKLPVFIFTKQKVIDVIVTDLRINASATVYELGCGTSSFLRQVRGKYPKANLVGIEYSFLPYLISRVINVIKNNNIKIIKENFLKINFKQADVVYCYLGRDIMKRLESKFRQECKSGALIISYQFPLPKIKSFKVVNVSEGEKVYFYKI